jgi:eukaryotic-like serine/threonine-protein kinase
VDTHVGTGPTDPAGEPQPAGPEAGTRIGRFVVTGPLGAGGMGVVVAAYDPDLDRKVAIKLLHPRLAERSDTLVARLLREAQAMARIRHPNVITVHEVGTYLGQVFIAMEYIDGGTLAAWLQRPRPWREVVAVFVAAGRGLAAAHALGLVHRDFKPDNVLVGRDGRVLVTDFGVVGVTGAAAGAPASPEAPPSPLAQTITRTGSVMGTPGYMAPEQAAGEEIDARADQYAFCVALYRAFVGRLPREQPPRIPPDAWMPRFLRPLVVRGLAPRPSDRHPSLAALLAAIERGPRVTARRALAAGALVAAAAAAVAWARTRPPATPPCAALGAHLAGIWAAPERAAVEKAFLATGVPYAAASFRTVAAALDGYAADWTRSRTDACEASAVRREQSPEVLDLRIACLDDRRRELGAAARALAAVDATTVAKAVGAVQLTPVAGCDDVAALRRRAPPPASPATRAAVDAVAEEVERASALARLGRARPAAPRLEAALGAARALGYAPLTARALLAAGKTRIDAGDATGGAAALADAVLAADQAGDDRLRAEALLRVAANARVRRQLPEARQAISATRAVLGRVGGDAPLEIDLLQQESLVAAADGRGAEAVTLARAALQRAEAAKLRGAALGGAVRALGDALDAAGDRDGALAAYERCLPLLEADYGHVHPRVAAVICNVGALHFRRGEQAAAEASDRECLRIDELLLAPDHVNLAPDLLNLGVVLLNQGRAAEALPLLERARAIADARLPPDHPQLANLYIMLAWARTEAGDARDALPLLERAIALADARPAATYDSANARLHLALAELRLGDRARARATAAEARRRAAGLADAELLAAIDAVTAR